MDPDFGRSFAAKTARAVWRCWWIRHLDMHILEFEVKREPPLGNIGFDPPQAGLDLTQFLPGQDAGLRQGAAGCVREWFLNSRLAIPENPNHFEQVIFR